MFKILFLLTIFLTYFNFNYSFINSILTTKRVGFILLIVMFLYMLISKKFRNLKFIYLDINYLLLFLFFNTIINSIVFNLNFSFYFYQLILNFFIINLLVLIILNINITIKLKDVYLIVIFGLFEYIIYIYYFLNIDFSNFIRSRFIMAEANFFALNSMYDQYVIIPIILLFYILYEKISIKYYILFIISLFILLLPLSRQVLGAFSISLFTFLYFSKISKKFLFILSSLLIVVFFYQELIFFIEQFSGRFEKGFNGGGGTILRLYQAIEAIEIGIIHPFGIGLGNFYFFQYGLRKPDIEDGHLQIFTEGGVIIFVIWIFIWFNLYRKIFNIKYYNFKLFVLLYGITNSVLFVCFFNEVELTPIFLYLYLGVELSYFYIKKRRLRC